MLTNVFAMNPCVLDFLPNLYNNLDWCKILNTTIRLDFEADPTNFFLTTQHWNEGETTLQSSNHPRLQSSHFDTFKS